MSDVEATGAVQNPGEGTGPEANPGEGGTPEVFTQQQVDELVRRREKSLKRMIGKAREEASKQAAQSLAERLGVDVDELDDFADRARATADDAGKVKQYEAKLQRTNAELEKLQGELAAERAKLKAATIRDRVFAHASKTSDIELLHHYLSGSLDVDGDGDVVVLGPGGEPSEMTLEEKINQVLADKPVLKVAAPAGGAGSLPGNGVGQPHDFDMNTREGRVAFMQAYYRKSQG